MGCNCKGNKKSPRTPQASRGIAAASNPRDVQDSTAPLLNSAGLSAERRKVQSLRREAITRALNK